MPTVVARRAPKSPPLDPRRVKRLGDSMLAELGLVDAELSVLLTDDATIAQLNERHRGKARPTDVLAFPQHEPWPPECGASNAMLLGDVVISLDTATRQAAGRRRELIAEIRLLLAHGLLHLVGHDHATAEQKQAMGKATQRLTRAAAI